MIFQFLGVLGIYIFKDYLIPTSETLNNDLSIAILIMGLSILFCFSQIHRALLDSAQLGYKVSTIMISQNIVIVGLASTLAYLGFGIKGQAFAHFAGLFSSFFLLKLQTKKLIASDTKKSFKKSFFDLHLKKQRSSQVLFQLCGRLSLLTDNLIISAFLGAKSVTSFYLTQRLILIAMQQLQNFGNASWPAMSELYLSKEYQKFKENLVNITEIIALASGCILSTLVIVNPSFVQLWTGESTFAGTLFSNIVICNAGLIAINSFWLWCFTGIGEIRLALPMLISQTVLNLVVSFIGTFYFGYLGPVTGTLISFLLISQPWTTWLIHKKFSVPLGQLSRAWIIPLCIPLAVSFFSTAYFGNLTASSWLSLGLWSTLLGLCSALIYPLLLVKKSSRLRVYTYFLSLIKRN